MGKETINEIRVKKAKERFSWMVQKFVESGSNNLTQFCEQNGLDCYTALYRHIKKYHPNITLDVSSNGKTKKRIDNTKRTWDDIDPCKLRSLYAEGKTLKEIGLIYGRSPGTICHWLKRFGIKARNHSERVSMWVKKEDKRELSFYSTHRIS